jgi:hypothetical protein
MITNVAIRSIQDGKIYSLPKPNRHYNVISMMVSMGLSTPIKGEQGFLTEDGVFLTRSQAAIEAIESGQIIKLKWTKRELFSEDLW